MIETKSSQLSAYKLEIDDPLFFAFITSNDACDLLRKIEEQYHLRFRFEKKSVTLEGRGRISVDAIKNILVEAWKEDDFKRAIEVSELTNLSDFQLYFKVSPAESALMQVNAKKLLRCPDLIAFKADASGNVCLFGKNSSAFEIYEMVSEVVCQAAMCGNFRLENKAYFDGPCTLSMRIPQRTVPCIFSPENVGIIELQKSCHFLIEKLEPSDETDQRLGILVNIFTKSFEDALKVKDAICAQIDLFNGAKRKSFGEIKLQCGTFTISFSTGANGLTNKDGFKMVLSAVEIQLIFWVQERDAPRIIGSHGITKKRIQECSKCKVLLHTETKRNGFFPVEIIGPNIQKCVETRHRIESFLMQTPPVIQSKEQQWGFPVLDDHSHTVDEMSSLPCQRAYLYVSDTLSPQQGVSRSLVPSNSFSQPKTCGNNQQTLKTLMGSQMHFACPQGAVSNESL